jgi:DMSO/TMAO reductase YedYZ molybdopterin-dependent catalytic subunit
VTLRGPGHDQRLSPTLTRRSFLRLMAYAGALLAGCGLAPRTTNTLPSLATAPPRATLPPTPSIAAGRLTPVKDLYLKTYRTTPQPVPKENWQIVLGGLMASPLTYTWADLQSFAIVEQMHTLECIGNPVGGLLFGNELWQGIRLRDVLAAAAPTAHADHLQVSGVDSYVTTIPLELALDERSLLAFSVGGAPLPPSHGFPVRVLLPGVYGQKQPKWVIALEAVSGSKAGTWETQGWSDAATVQINSRIDYPPNGSQIPRVNSLPVSGVAFADNSGVARLEVSVDGGQTWQDARLYPGPTSMAWTVWAWEWETPPPGQHTLKARATSGAGQTQVDAGGFLTNVFPDGTTSIHSVSVTV